ncbi:MAG: CpXC domain-containing protein [Anaerolineae bacterium]|nr:CpXC domain-containing protein [Anaerolineae bacterium]MDW8103105.1 CpXC domain-containing protein [Anaerolineae bacterium]
MNKTAIVTCPRCGQKFTTVIHNIVDASRNPELRELLIRGRLNVAVCPYCRAGGTLNVPIYYYNPEKELALVYLSAQVGANDLERQKVIGNLTNQLINSLPQEERKAYLLQPKVFITYRSFLEEIIKAEDIPYEEIIAEEMRLGLIEALLASPKEEWGKILESNIQLIDPMFFQILSGFVAEAHRRKEPELVNKLGSIRKEVEEFLSRRMEEAREALISELMELKGEDLERAVARIRPILDYEFYRDLAERIDKREAQGKSEEAQKLRELRDQLLDITARQDAEVRRVLTKARDLLRDIWDSEDRLKALEERAEDVNMAFLEILAASMEWARDQGDMETLQDLASLAEKALEIIRRKAPPQIKLVNELMDASYPEETKRILEDNVSLVNAELLGLMDELSRDLEREGYTEAARHLSMVRRQAEGMVYGTAP